MAQSSQRFEPPQKPGRFTADFHDTGELDSTCTVQTAEPLAEGPIEGLAFYRLLFPDTPAQVLVLCAASGGTAEYFLFDPVEPRVKLALHFANKSGRLLITGTHAGQVTNCPVEGSLFEDLPRMLPSKNERQRAEWLLNVVQVAQTLPHTFSVWEPSLAQVEDHRAYLMRPTARLATAEPRRPG